MGAERELKTCNSAKLSQNLAKKFSIKRSKGQFIHQTQRQPRMLQHMFKTQILDLIFRRMDLGVGIIEIRFNDEGGRIACFGRRRMIGASVSALGQDVGNGAVLRVDVSMID